MKRKEPEAVLRRGPASEGTADVQRLEQALRDSELQFRTLADTTSAAILLFGADDRILYANPATSAISEFPPEELHGKKLWDLIHPDSHAGILLRRETRRRGEPVPVRSTLKIVTKSGSERWIDYCAGFADIKGERITIGTAFDITEQRRAEDEIRRERDFSEAILNSLPGIFYLYDENLKFIRWNDNFERVTGYDAEEMARLSPLDLFAGADKVLLAQRIRRVFEVGPTDVEADFVTKSGKRIPYYFTGQPTRLDGRLCLIGTGIDVTKRRQAENDLRTTQRRLEEAQARAHLGSWEIDPVLQQGYWSAEMYRIYERDPELGPPSFREFFALTHPDDHARLTAVYLEAARLGQAAAFEFRALTSSGAVRHLSGTIHCFLDDQRRVIRLAGTVLDVTERRRAEEEQQHLREALRRSEIMAAMGALVGGVAHEVRNPLFGMTATLDALQARFSGLGEIEPYLGVLRGELNRLSELMRDLLEYGRAYSITLSAGELRGVIDEAVDACRTLAESSGATAMVDDALPQVRVRMERVRLRQVFENLLRNALQLSPPGGVVVLATRAAPQAGWVECTVTDQGPGFRPEDLGSVFDPFFSRRKGGTGLGLSIVQRIVEEHGGTVTAANRADGGAVMTVRLPIEGA